MKISVVFANFGPYHLARVNGFNKICHQLNWSFNGIELARYQEEYPWQAKVNQEDYEIFSLVNNKKLEQANFFGLVKKLYQRLSRIKPDIVVLSGYSRPTMISALFWSILHRRPVILFSESKENDAQRSKYLEIIKGTLVKLYKAALVGGSIHKDYLVKLGMSQEAIFYGYDVVNNAVFSPQKIGSLSMPLNKPYFLSINRFIEKKNLISLIESYERYRYLVGDSAWDLVLCGDGELKEKITAKIAELDLQNCVHLPGFLQQEQLLHYFAHASCFVHASTTEQWGLVVNEAMAAGLPVLVSERCGCFEDLVIEGVNGFGFNPENSAQLTQLMSEISSERTNLKKMGQASLEHIKNYSPDYFATGLRQAVEYAMSH